MGDEGLQFRMGGSGITSFRPPKFLSRLVDK